MLRDYEKYHKEGNALHQARNQLGSPDGMKSFLKRAQILCPTHCYRGFAAPGYGPALHPLKRRHFSPDKTTGESMSWSVVPA